MEIYADTLEEELDPDDLILLVAKETTTYREAATNTMWQEAMQNELEAIEKNKTWALTNLPPEHNSIDLK